MKIIKNNFIPFKGFSRINLLGFVFLRNDVPEGTITDLRHEALHTVQQYEIIMVSAVVSLLFCNIFGSWWYLAGVLVMPFIVYLLGFIVEMILPPYYNATSLRQLFKEAYYDNCFEREVYANENNPDYWITRPLFAEFRYLPKRKQS